MTYSAYKNPIDGIIKVIPLGWSWPAFFWGGLWAILNNMAWIGILAIVCSVIAFNVSGPAWWLETIISSFLFGLNGSLMLVRKQERLGAIFVGSYEGATAES